MQLRPLFHFILRHFPLLGLLGLPLSCTPQASPELRFFRLGIYAEPGHLDPQRAKGSAGNPLLHNLYRGLYWINGDSKLETAGGSCQWQGTTRLLCRLSPRTWSDGTPIRAEDYLYAWRKLVTPSQGSPWSHLLENVENARAILQNEKTPESLGVEMMSPQEILIRFDKEDPHFLYKLATLAMVPRRVEHDGDPRRLQPSQWPTSGPFHLGRWQVGEFVELLPHPDPRMGQAKAPVRLYVLESDRTSLRLFQKGDLDFVRRLPSELTQALKNRSDFHWIELARFDYLGFGGALSTQTDLRRALLHGIDFQALQKLLNAKGRPGCPSFPGSWTGEPVCLKFDLSKARKHLQKVEPVVRSQTLHFYFSQLGGEDIQKQAEFFQAQWRQHLGLQIELHAMEQKSYLHKLQGSLPDFFRRGVSLDWPTCYEAFASLSTEPIARALPKGQLDTWLKDLEKSASDPKSCRTSVLSLLDTAQLIPLGQYEYGVLANPDYRGWSLNQLNQLDLSQLHRLKPI